MDPIFRMLYYSEMYKNNSSGHYTMMTLSQNLEQVPGHSIEEIAELCHTNAMSLSRFVRKIGYRSFSEFRAAVEDNVSQYRYLNRNIPLNETNPLHPAQSFLDYMEKKLQAIRNSDLLEQIDRICPLLHRAGDIHYYGPPFQSLYIIMLLYDLMMDKKKISMFTSAEGIQEDLSSINRDSVILIEPNSMSTGLELCRKVLEEADRKQAAVILMTENHSPLLQYSPCGSLTYDGDHTAASVLSLELALNMLTMEYRARYIDR